MHILAGVSSTRSGPRPLFPAPDRPRPPPGPLTPHSRHREEPRGPCARSVDVPAGRSRPRRPRNRRFPPPRGPVRDRLAGGDGRSQPRRPDRRPGHRPIGRPGGLRRAGQPARRTAGTPVVAIGDDDRAADVRAALAAGARSLLAWPDGVADLPGELARVALTGQPGSSAGHAGLVIATRGVQGGAGTTTVAIHLAAAWARWGPTPVLLLDLAGGLAFRLDLGTGPNLVHPYAGRWVGDGPV